MKNLPTIPKELLEKYIEYASSVEALAVLFVKKELKESVGHWIDIIEFESYDNTSYKDLEFKFVICGLYRRTITPKYPPKSNFTVNGKFDEKYYIQSIRAITWSTAHEDIQQQKNKGVKAAKYEIRGVRYDKNRGIFVKRPPWLDSPAWKDVNPYLLRGADRAYVQQFLAPADWRYEIKYIQRLST
jgi:hypothetical protein